ncbi:MAG: MFS transporter [Pirellulales bacterium]|nr:MFS transporter [Pirellulales bacterium]
MSSTEDPGIAPNAKRLLWAGFMAILAAGVGFSIRGGILGDWGEQFGFTQGDLGKITGGGLTGFGIIILIGALLADKLGYGTLMCLAFVAHLSSAVLTLAATPIFTSMGGLESEAAKNAAYFCLFWGMFLFAIGNGIAEAVVNPLVATLFPKSKTHYLNILHAGWPAGLIVGGLLSYFMVEKVRWEIQIGMFLIPTVFYGLMLLGQKFPKSEASQRGVSYVEMLKQVGVLGAAIICGLLALFFIRDLGFNTIVGWGLAAGLLILFGFFTEMTLGPVLLAFLLIIHALVGYVELGTDSWIANITGNIMASPQKGLLLFVYTSGLMFVLRFFAGPIVHQISPLGLLFVSALMGALGLYLLGGATTAVACIFAATIYGFGKTYLWPTMLGVVSERFPKGGAITIGTIGGVGMLSAGLLGGPGIGYKQDYFASTELKKSDPALYEEYKSDSENGFLVFPKIQGLDGTKVGEIRDKEVDERNEPEQAVGAADLYGGKMALRYTGLIPATMAVCYLLLILYFRSIGGYTAVHLDAEQDETHPSHGDPPGVDHHVTADEAIADGASGPTG